MKRTSKEKIIYWSKRGVGVAALFVWIAVMMEIVQSKESFIEQAPYCMVSTMIIFGLLSALFKALEWWQERE